MGLLNGDFGYCGHYREQGKGPVYSVYQGFKRIGTTETTGTTTSYDILPMVSVVSVVSIFKLKTERYGALRAEVE